MNIIRTTKRILLLVMMSVAAPAAFGAGTEITRVDAKADGNTVRIEIELTAPVKPTVHMAGQMGLLVLDFPNVALQTQSRRIMINHAGVGEIHAAVHSAVPLDTWIVVRIDSSRPYGIETDGNKLVLRILPHPGSANASAAQTCHPVCRQYSGARRSPGRRGRESADCHVGLPRLRPKSTITWWHLKSTTTPIDDSPATVRHRFKIKFIAGTTAYIDGGSNAGLRVGMNSIFVMQARSRR